MKIQLLALPMVGFWALGAQAQTPTTPATSTQPVVAPLDPAIADLLNKAIATYKDASGLSFRVSTAVNGKQAEVSTIRFARPDKIAVEQGSGANARRFLQTDGAFYIVQGTSYRKQPALPLSGGQMLEGTTAAVGSFLAALLDGKNPIAESQKNYAQAPLQKFQSRAIALAPRVIDGDVLTGVQSTFTYNLAGAGGKTIPVSNQTTAWFGGSPLTLRRVQAIYTREGKSTTFSEKITDQQVSPAYAADTFKFNDTGLKLASEEEPKYFDERLKTGAAPFAFAAKGLDGKPLSLTKYKGKVVLMDFWATWCGPCVASLPELKGAYEKYHAKGLEVIGISLDEDKSALTSFIKTRKMPWPQIFDGKGWGAEVPGVYGVKAIPFMLVIGKDGKIASVNPRGKIDEAVKAALAAS